MLDARLAALIEPILATFAMELDSLDVVPAGKRRLLRITVDGDGPEGRGLLLDDIAEATQAISRALDDGAAMGERPYTLEVSSRGVSKPLTEAKHWRRNAGRLVALTLSGGEQLTGRIAAVDDTTAALDVDGQTRSVVYADVTRAVVQVELNRPVADGDEDEDDNGDADDADES